ncbi:MAG: class I SAM-dependent methyltransferase [Minisyncoccia bacterium]
MLKKIKKFITNKDEYYPNIEIFGYHFLKSIRKVAVKLHFSNPKNNDKDMFDWTLYHLHYLGELKKVSKYYTQSLKKNDYVLKNGKLIKNNQEIKPLHESHEFLYETILQLNPDSIFEMGCGTGMHLHNLSVLLPNKRICGIDLSDKQLKSLEKTYPHLKNNISQSDATTLFTKLPFEQCDLTYTQAVIMHIRTDELHLIALENLFAMSKKYVILMEAMKNHDYLSDIKKLFNSGKIKWDKIFFYYRINNRTGRPNGIICSNTPLDYPELKSDSIFNETH